MVIKVMALRKIEKLLHKLGITEKPFITEENIRSAGGRDKDNNSTWRL